MLLYGHGTILAWLTRFKNIWIRNEEWDHIMRKTITKTSACQVHRFWNYASVCSRGSFRVWPPYNAVLQIRLHGLWRAWSKYFLVQISRLDWLVPAASSWNIGLRLIRSDALVQPRIHSSCMIADFLCYFLIGLSVLCLLACLVCLLACVPVCWPASLIACMPIFLVICLTLCLQCFFRLSVWQLINLCKRDSAETSHSRIISSFWLQQFTVGYPLFCWCDLLETPFSLSWAISNKEPASHRWLVHLYIWCLLCSWVPCLEPVSNEA